MINKQLFDLLDKEKEKLFQAKSYISTYYYEIATSLETLRDNIFPYSFTSNNLWKTAINKSSASLSVPDMTPENLKDDPEFNSNMLITLINNIYSIQNLYLNKPSEIDLQDIKQINKVHGFLLLFLQNQYSHQNLAPFKKKQLELAVSIKTSIENRIINTINPFFQRLEMIKSDEYVIYLFDAVKSLVGSFENYKAKARYYDREIEKKCSELNIKNNPELNLLLIADLGKSEALLNIEIKAKYESEEKEKPASKSYRLREIAYRYISQTENIAKLEYFFQEFYNIIQTPSFLKRLFLFFISLFSIKRPSFSYKDMLFRYSNPEGKIEIKQASLLQLIKRISSFHQFLAKSREQLSYFTSLKGIDTQGFKDIEKVVDTCFFELNDIHEQSTGFREWLGKEHNKKILKKIPEKRQYEFSSLILTINRIVIVNKYNLMDFEKYKILTTEQPQ
ncbi:MAG: hypothetical protein JW822_00445 [Spirochaetales bacterium]|nr:hypothetical protein [Spirochaetales bacterium]